MKKPELTAVSIGELARCTGGLGGVQSKWHPEDFRASWHPFSLGAPPFALAERQYQSDARDR